MKMTIEPLHQGSRVMRVRVFLEDAAVPAVEFSATGEQAAARADEAIAILCGPRAEDQLGGLPSSECR